VQIMLSSSSEFTVTHYVGIGRCTREQDGHEEDLIRDQRNRFVRQIPT